MSAEAPLVPVLADGKRPQRIENGLAIKNAASTATSDATECKQHEQFNKALAVAVRKTVTSMQWEMSMLRYCAHVLCGGICRLRPQRPKGGRTIFNIIFLDAFIMTRKLRLTFQMCSCMCR